MAINELKTLKEDAKASERAYNDFIKLWELCNDNSSPLSIVPDMITHSEDQNLNKKIAWILICAHKIPKSEGNTIGAERRKMILFIAACISFSADLIESASICECSNFDQSKTTQDDEMKSRVQDYHRRKRARRAAIKETVSLLDIGMACGNTEIVEGSEQIKNASVNSDARSTLDSVTLAVNSLVPSLSVGSDEIELETSKIAAHVQKLIQLGKFEAGVLSDEKGKKEFIKYLEDTTAKASGTIWMDEVSSFDTDLRSFLTVSRSENSAPFSTEKWLAMNHKWIELNDWIETLLSKCSHSVLRPSRNLLTFLETPSDRMQSNRFNEGNCLEKIIVPMLNGCLSRFVKIMEEDENTECGVVCLNKEGELQYNGSDLLGQQTHNLCTTTIIRAFVVLYYGALECILYHERVRLRSSTSKRLVMNSDFHRSIVCLSFICLSHLIPSHKHARDSRWRCDFAFDISQSNYYDYLKLSENFSRSLSYPFLDDLYALKLPEVLLKELQNNEEAIFQYYLWQDSAGHTNKLFKTIGILKKNCCWPPTILEEIQMADERKCIDARSKESNSLKREFQFIEYCMTKILVMAGQNISSLCAELGIISNLSLIMSVFRRFLRGSIDIFRNRHIDTIMLCIIYSLCRSQHISPEKTFSEILFAHERVFGSDLRDVIRTSILIEGSKRGDIVNFYNHCFLDHIMDCIKEECAKDPSGSFGPNISANVQNGLKGSGVTLRRIQTFGSAMTT